MAPRLLPPDLASHLVCPASASAAFSLQPRVAAGKREVFFEANGVPRVVEVTDKKAELVVGKKAVREKVDLAVLGSVGAPMAGTIIEVRMGCR